MPIDPKEDLVAIYCMQLLGGRLRRAGRVRDGAYQSIVGD
jgi:hypothetical protein